MRRSRSAKRGSERSGSLGWNHPEFHAVALLRPTPRTEQGFVEGMVLKLNRTKSRVLDDLHCPGYSAPWKSNENIALH